MNGIKILKKQVIKSQFFVSICATLLGVFFWMEQESYHFENSLVVFFTFWLGYSYLIFQKNKRTLIFGIIGCIVLSIVILFQISFNFYIKWLMIILLGFLYNSYFLKFKIREIVFLKTFFVGFVWAMTLVFLPFKTFDLEIFIMVFLFVTGITIPFEIRDMKSDSIITIPKKFGIFRSQLFSIYLLVLSGIIAYFHLNTNNSIAFILSIFVAILLVIFSLPKRKDYYFSFFLESVSALPFTICQILTFIQK